MAALVGLLGVLTVAILSGIVGATFIEIMAHNNRDSAISEFFNGPSDKGPRRNFGVVSKTVSLRGRPSTAWTLPGENRRLNAFRNGSVHTANTRSRQPSMASKYHRPSVASVSAVATTTATMPVSATTTTTTTSTSAAATTGSRSRLSSKYGHGSAFTPQHASTLRENEELKKRVAQLEHKLATMVLGSTPSASRATSPTVKQKKCNNVSCPACGAELGIQLSTTASSAQ